MNTILYQLFVAVFERQGVLVSKGDTLCCVDAKHRHDRDNMELRAQIDSIDA